MQLLYYLKSNLRLHLDSWLLIALLLLCATGLLALWSASDQSSTQVLAQFMRLSAGFIGMFIISRIPPHVLRIWTPWLFAGSIILLLLVPLFGGGRSARSWLNLGVFYVQPAELLKLTVPMMVAWYLHNRFLPPQLSALVISLVIIAVPTILIAMQPDLGTAMLVFVSGVFVIFLSGLSWGRIGLLCATAAACTPVAWHFLHDYQRARLLMFLDPELDRLGAGWNIIQSQIAIGSGGFWGKGMGMSTQAKLNYLPEHTTDFIFSVFSEEFGWLGISFVMLLYLFIIGRCLWMASQARDTYARLLGGALSMTFFVYVMVNGGMITGLLPVVGVPMPLISYGGTSAVSLLAGFGILFSIYAHRRWRATT